MEVLGNKVVIITGGAGALGLVTAKLYLSKSSSVMLVDNDKEALKLAGSVNCTYITGTTRVISGGLNS